MSGYSEFWRRVKSFLSHYIVGLYDRAGEHHIFLLAGGLAFSLFVCIVPFVLIIFSFLGNFLSQSSFRLELDSIIGRAIPYPEYANFIRDFIYKRIDEFRLHSHLAGYLGAIGLLLAASGLFSSIRTILNRVFVLRKGENYFLGKLRDLGMVLLVALIFMAITAVFPIFDFLRNAAEKTDFLNFLRFGGRSSIIVTILSFLLTFSMFGFLYYLIPHARLGWKVPLLSAFWATIFWEFAKWGFGYYLTHLASLKQIYGAYVLGVAIAFWIYYASIIFILAAEIGQLYRERRV